MDARRDLVTLVATMLLLGSALCFAVRVAGNGSNGSVPRLPRARVEGAQHDFGLVSPGMVLEHRFKVWNVGNARLVLNLDDCNCGSGLQDHLIVMPGDHVEVPVALTVMGRPERQQRIAVISTSDPQSPRIEFKLNAQVADRSAFDPNFSS